MLLTKQETAESYYNGTTQPLREQDKTLVFAFAEAIEAAVLEKLCAGVEMPEPVAFGPYSDLFTADQLRAYGAAQRLKALEDAEKKCEAISDEYHKREGMKYPELKTDAETGASDCEMAIRALKGETP